MLGPSTALCAGLTPFFALWAVLGPSAAANAVRMCWAELGCQSPGTCQKLPGDN